MNKLVAIFGLVLMLPISLFLELLPIVPSAGVALAEGEFTITVGESAVTDVGIATTIEGVSI